jgi:putative RNA 2'-phosphotransferase
LSWLLRHGARTAGVTLNEAGWASLDEVLRVSGLVRHEVEAIVANDPKRRLQIEGGRIRACQGHTPQSGVTPEGLEASWMAYTADAPVWHGTSVEAAERIAREGILPIERTHVHAAPTADGIVGRRTSTHVLLQIDPRRMRQAGLGLFIAPNGVVLARRIPRQAITGLVPLTRRARKAATALRGAFGLPASDGQEPTTSGAGSRPTLRDPEGSASDPR